MSEFQGITGQNLFSDQGFDIFLHLNLILYFYIVSHEARDTAFCVPKEF